MKPIFAGLLYVSLLLQAMFHSELYVGLSYNVIKIPLLISSIWIIYRFRTNMRRRNIGLVLLIYVIGFHVAHKIDHQRLNDIHDTKSRVNLDLMTYNIYFRNNFKKQVVDVIQEQASDVVLLQEVTSAWKTHLQDANLPYPYSFYHTAETAHGLAVLSRYPIRLVEIVNNKHGLPIAQIFECEKEGKKILITNLHLASPAGALAKPSQLLSLYKKNYLLRANQYSKINRKMHKLATKYPTQLMIGDLNTHLAEPLINLVRKDWVDMHRQQYFLPQPTFPYVKKINFPVLTLDYMFCRGKLKIDRIHVIKAGSSDHLPMIGEIRF